MWIPDSCPRLFELACAGGAGGDEVKRGSGSVWGDVEDQIALQNIPGHS